MVQYFSQCFQIFERSPLAIYFNHAAVIYKF